MHIKQKEVPCDRVISGLALISPIKEKVQCFMIRFIEIQLLSKIKPKKHKIH